MAYRIEKNEIIIDGFEKGISDSPYSGLNDMRGMNIVSVPGEAAVSFAQTNQAPNSLIGTITSVDTGTEIITGNITSGAVGNYTAVQFTTTGALPNPLVANTTYWVNMVTSNSFKLFDNCYLNGSAINLTTSGSGTNTFTSINMNDTTSTGGGALVAGTGGIRYFERNYGYALDWLGRCWSPTSAGTYTYMGNSTTNASGNGLVVFKGSGTQLYLFVFRNAKIDYTTVGDITASSYATPNWQADWKTLNTAAGVNNPHEAIISTNNFIYFVDDSYVGSINEIPGQTFDPATSSTYTYNSKALTLPYTDIGQCLDQLGNNILIGGLYNYVYPWDRLSSAFNYPILIAEKKTARIITVNTNAYIFAGTRGRIFVTNGSQAQLFKKVPDHILGIDPAFTFGGVAYNKNQLYFGVSAKTNGGTVSSAYAGLWAVDLDTQAMRVVTLQSTTTATVTAMWSNPSTTSGFGLQTAWKTVNASDVLQTAGIDSGTSSPYTTYVSYINTDIIPIGQYLKLQTFNNIEFKLSAPLVSGEGIKILYRTNLTDNFADVAANNETTTVGAISDVYTPLTFQNVQWIQLQIQTKSTASSPSYVRLTEVRLRANPANQ